MVLCHCSEHRSVLNRCVGYYIPRWICLCSTWQECNYTIVCIHLYSCLRLIQFHPWYHIQSITFHLYHKSGSQILLVTQFYGFSDQLSSMHCVLSAGMCYVCSYVLTSRTRSTARRLHRNKVLQMNADNHKLCQT